MGGVQQSPITITAGLAAAILLASIGWQLGGEMRSTGPPVDPLTFERPTTQKSERPAFEGRNWQEELARLGLISTSTESLGEASSSIPYIGDILAEQMISGYLALKESERYTPERGRALGQFLGQNARIPSTFVVHGEKELTISTDISLANVLAYREAMRTALAPLISDDAPEIELFGFYIETKNPARLDDLRSAVERYKQAEVAALAVEVPQDSASLHLRVVNALGAYADALNHLILYADDALATVVTLRTYNEAEREMMYAFDALAEYYVRRNSGE